MSTAHKQVRLADNTGGSTKAGYTWQSFWICLMGIDWLLAQDDAQIAQPVSLEMFNIAHCRMEYPPHQKVRAFTRAANFFPHLKSGTHFGGTSTF